MDALSDPDVENVVIMSSAQVGKTEFILNIIGYFVDQDPSPILSLQPTLQMAETFSKDRLAPMVRDTPVLTGKIKDARSRDSGNTLLKKNFPGGHITLAGANSPASLASRPVRVVLCDEVDRYPASAGTEGDPVNLARKRTTTFHNRKIVLTNTPTNKGASRIEDAYEASDRRRYYVPCPHCGEKQPLEWHNIQWPEGEPEEAMLVCSRITRDEHNNETEHGCGALIDEKQKMPMLLAGGWIAEGDSKRSAGFHLNELYSPWVRWAETAQDFLEAKGNPETLKTFINTALGETWEEQGEQLEADDLFARRETYSAEVPQNAIVLTAAVDVQDDRLEMEVVGWGEGEESWGIEYRTIYGDLSQPGPWDDLDKALLKVYEHESGAKLRIAAACIDSGGHFTKMVYAFVKDKKARRVFAIKGMGGEGRAVVTAPVKKKIARQKVPVDLFTVGTDEAKAVTVARLKVTEGAGLCHWPMKYNLEYFKQLTAEKVVTKFKKGFKVREWVKTRPRNEAFDLRVYAYAALVILNPVFELIKKSLVPEPKSKQEKSRQRKRKQRGGFVNRW